VADVDRIGAMELSLIRNLLITQGYHTLALALQAITGPGANWSAFATWASKQAGYSIRGEDVFALVRRALDCPVPVLHLAERFWRRLLRAGLLAPQTTLGAIVAAVEGPLDTLERVSAAVARGNLKVFIEIGRDMARWFETCDVSAPDAEAQFTAFLATLPPGPPPDGRDLLREAFSHYWAARQTPDEHHRAELLLLGTCKIGFHEQTRLQAEIAEALDAPVVEARQLGHTVLSLFCPGLAAWVPQTLTVLLGRGACMMRRHMQRRVRELITAGLMVFTLPDGRVLCLGDNIEDPPPPVLAALQSPALQEIYRRFDSEQAARTGADDWADLPQRMQFITRLFRCFHAHPDLFQEPFTAAQMAAIQAGRLPLC
jgi:hypothetical protein